MTKTEPMKRYEAETGKEAIDYLTEYPFDDYTRWLEAQLTWRPVSEKPERAGLYFVEAEPYTECEYIVITTAYFDGESFLWHTVVRWLPIPPAPDTLPDGWEATNEHQ